MKQAIKTIFTTITLLGIVTQVNAEASVEKTMEGFTNPESILIDPRGKIYVSEIGEFGKDGDGAISLIAGNKRKTFATGMDDPKGLAYHAGNLYVADKNRILKVSKNGKWTVFIPATAFPETPQFLNDLVADKSGHLYVSDSGDLQGQGGVVYRISPKGKVSTLISSRQDRRILAPNGLLIDGNQHLLMVDFFSGSLYRIVLKTGRMSVVAEGFGGGDGLVRDRKGKLWISDWKNGRLFSLKKDGTINLVKDGFKAAADIELAADGKTILVPDMKAGQVLWVKEN